MDSHFFLAGRSYYKPPQPVTEKLLAEFEEVWRVQLPKSYVELLRIQNGGCPRRTLFVSADQSEYVLQELAGIGPDQGGGRDLLESIGAWTERSDEGNQIVAQLPREVIPFDGDGHEYLALDYRKCGPDGEPGVVSICCEDPPVLYFPVATTFREFIDGLLRDDANYYFGFFGMGDDPTTLVRFFEAEFKVKPEISDYEGSHEYTFRHPAWRTRPRLTLMPNVDYAHHYDRESGDVLRRPAGHYFPEYPTCKWMLTGSVPDDVLDDLRAVLKRQPFDYLALHQPREDMSVPVSESHRPSRVHEFQGLRVELPDSMQGPAMQVTDPHNPNIDSDIFSFWGDYFVHFKQGELIVDGRSYGRVKRGDSIRVVEPGEVYVNDKSAGA